MSSLICSLSWPILLLNSAGCLGRPREARIPAEEWRKQAPKSQEIYYLRHLPKGCAETKRVGLGAVVLILSMETSLSHPIRTGRYLLLKLSLTAKYIKISQLQFLILTEWEIWALTLETLWRVITNMPIAFKALMQHLVATEWEVALDSFRSTEPSKSVALLIRVLSGLMRLRDQEASKAFMRLMDWPNITPLEISPRFTRDPFSIPSTNQKWQIRQLCPPLSQQVSCKPHSKSMSTSV